MRSRHALMQRLKFSTLANAKRFNWLQELRADLLLIDERRGRFEAKRRALPTTGTLGVLLEAQKRGLIDAEAGFQRLINETSFRATPAVRGTFVQQCREVTEKERLDAIVDDLCRSVSFIEASSAWCLRVRRP